MFQKKSLGQNFLTSTKALREIIEASEITTEDTILEIGPGDGALTKHILEKNPNKLIVVEKDDRLIPILEQKFSEEIQKGKLVVVHADIIDELEKGVIFPKEQFKIIANIPYYITGLIIRNIFSLKSLPERVVLLVQKEVADRIVDSEKNSLLRACTTLYGDVKRVSVVPKGAFSPAPNVDSAILLIKNIEKPYSENFEEAYFTVVKNAFAHKRKKASRNLEGVFDKDSAYWESAFEQFGLQKSARPEDISTAQYKDLVQTLLKN